MDRGSEIGLAVISDTRVIDMGDRSRCQSRTLCLAIWDKGMIQPDEGKRLDRSPRELQRRE